MKKKIKTDQIGGGKKAAGWSGIVSPTTAFKTTGIKQQGLFSFETTSDKVTAQLLGCVAGQFTATR